MRKFRGKVERDRPKSPGISRRRAGAWILPGILLYAFACPVAAAQANAKNVLVLFSSAETHSQALNVIETGLRARLRVPINFYIAHLINDNIDDEIERRYLQSQAETFRQNYAGVKMDLVVAFSPQALMFMIDYRDKVFPGVPIVFTEVGTREFAGLSWPNTTGLTVPVGIRETIDLALRLHPDTKTVAVISGPDWYWLDVTRSEILRHGVKDRLIIRSPASREMLEEVGALPPHTVVLFHLSPGIENQPQFSGWDLLAVVTRRFPTYSAWPGLCLNHGCIGGAYSDVGKQGAKVAEIAARILSGEQADTIPVVHDNSLQATVDWRALQHWHVPESALPPGTLILYRPPSIWDQYRSYILAAIAVLVAQTLLIVGLLWQRARKRRAEAVLRESEERFRVMADTTPSLIWMCDAQGKITYLNEQRLAFTGPDPHAGYGDTWIAFIHPDDVKGVLDALWQALKDQRPFSKEYRLHRNDGAYRWMFDVASPRVNGDGAFAGFIGSAIDVTDQKLAQDALQNVSGQLIEAQEKERTRIARDLHDDICQRLALLSMELQQAQRVPHGSVSATKKSLEEIRKHCSEIASDVQSLSHELHSSKLDYLGVVAAVRGFCREFSKQHGVIVDFTDRGVPSQLPKDISLCLFRVAQEALHNAVKYSGVSEFKVDLYATSDEIRLQVSDAGAGFDVEEARKNRGLGLVSMQERVHLVHGRFTAESKPGAGTRIRAVLPLIPENALPLGGGEVGEAAGSVQTACQHCGMHAPTPMEEIVEETAPARAQGSSHAVPKT